MNHLESGRKRLSESIAKILMVEDDEFLAQSLTTTIQVAGFKHFHYHSIAKARAALSEQSFDLILLDVALPDGNGISFCSELRHAGNRLPIILLTSRADEDSVVRGLNAGANDYLRKPFGNRELIARIVGALRIFRPLRAPVCYRNLTIDPQERIASYKSKKLPLNRRQFDILHYFALNAEQIVTRDKLLAHLGNDQEVFCRSIDTHISSIRKVLRDAEVLNIRISMIYGAGYRLEENS